MSSCLQPSPRRIIPVRVADVPIDLRRHAANVAIKREQDEYERLRIRLIAENPGDLVAWIAP